MTRSYVNRNHYTPRQWAQRDRAVYLPAAAVWLAIAAGAMLAAFLDFVVKP